VNFKSFLPISLLVLFLVVVAFGSDSGKIQKVRFEKIEFSGVEAGHSGEVSLRFVIEDGFHVQANPASEKNLIATELKIEGILPEGVEVGTPSYPKGVAFKLLSSKKTIQTYEGKFQIGLPVTLSKIIITAAPRVLKTKLLYQACDKHRCFFPVLLPVEIAIP